jgi:hypothetical protein
MTIEPTSEQRAYFQGLAQGEISLAQFLSLREQAAFDRYRAASERTLRGGLDKVTLKRSRCVTTA